MTYLARIEQFDLYVSATTVHFHPKAPLTGPAGAAQRRLGLARTHGHRRRTG